MNNTRKILNISKMFYEISERILNCKSSSSKNCTLSINEGLERTAISRAYYAVFFIAREALGLRNIHKPDIHKEIVKRIANDGYKDLADKIIYLRRMRNNADYNIYFAIEKRLFKNIVLLAKYVIRELKDKYTLNASDPRTERYIE